MRNRLWQGFVVLTFVAIASCGLTQKVTEKASEFVPQALQPAPKLTRIEASVEAVAYLNPDPSGRPSPVVVRLYELRKPSVFSNADFFSLYEQDGTVLGADLVTREDILVKPADRLELERTLAEETRHLGLLAAYRDLDQAVWRATVTVEPNKTTPVRIVLRRNAISVSLSDD